MLKIIADELTEYTVALNADASKVEQFAATELRTYLEKGIARKLCDNNCGRQFFRFQVQPDSDIQHDGFRIALDGRNVLIQAIRPKGILNAVYSLLADNGYRWLWLNPENEVIPDLQQLCVREQLVNPDLEFRGACIFPVTPEDVPQLREIFDWFGKNRFNLLMTSASRTRKRDGGWIVEWLEVADDLYPELEKRGIELCLGEHQGRYFFPKSLFEEHPDWFAVGKDGQRSAKGQNCYSNEAGVDYLVKQYVKFAEEHPEIRILGTWPEDGYGFCQCPDCQKPGQVLKAVNRIAEAVEKVRPDLMVEYLSYTEQTSDVPPEILPRKNILTLVANTKVAEEWQRKSDLVGAQGVYRLHYHLTDNTAERANLPLRIGSTQKDCQEAVQLRLRGIVPFFIGIDTWWRSLFNLYFLSQFSWNSQADPAVLLKELCRVYFPDNVEPMFALFTALEQCPRVDQFIQPPWDLWQYWPTLREDYTGEKWQAVDCELKRVRQLLKTAQEQAANSQDTHFVCIDKFLAFQEMMYLSWHHRALAVLAFDRGDAAAVKVEITRTSQYEDRLLQEVQNAENKPYGVSGAFPDYDFFRNWRLQLDMQLLEMRTHENQKPFVDMNPDVELFLPGLLKA